MAYIQPTGNGFSVRNGRTGNKIRWFGSQDDAEEFVRELHEKFDPDPRHRGERARERLEENDDE